MTTRRGVGKLGCLFSLLVAVAVTYFAVNIGEVYLRYVRLVDAMEQEVRFAANNSDDQIRRRLASFADSLGLPEAAGRVSIDRRGASVSLAADYVEQVELPLFVREFRFHARAPR